MAAFSINLFQIIFTEFLKISPDLLSKYPTIQDQLLYLILIPHAVLLLFIFSFGYWFVGFAHKGIRLVISLVAYIYLVWAGWYGTLVVPIVNAFLPLLIISWFLLFMFSRVFHPLNLPGASGVIKGASDKIKSSIQKSKDREKAEKELSIVKSRIVYLTKQLEKAEHDKNEKLEIEYAYQIGKLEDEKRRLELEL